MQGQVNQRAWVFNGAGSVIRDPNVALDTPQFTFLVCFLARSAGQFNSGLLFNHNASLNGSSGNNAWWLLAGSGPVLDFRYRWSVNNAQYRISFSLNRWYGFAVTYDRTLTADPKIYLYDYAARRLIVPSVTNVAGTPSGTANTAGLGYSIGNYDGADATWDGYIWRPRFLNWQMTQGQAAQELLRPGTFTRGLLLDLDDHGRDRSPKKAHASVFSSISYMGAPPGVRFRRVSDVLGMVPSTALQITLTTLVGKGAFGSFAVTTGPVSVAPASAVAKIIYGAFDAAPPATQNLNPSSVTAKGVQGSFTLAPGSVSITLAGMTAKGVSGAFTVTPGQVSLTLTGTVAKGAFGALSVKMVISPGSATAKVSLGGFSVGVGAVTVTPGAIVAKGVFGQVVVALEGEEAPQVTQSRVIVDLSPRIT